MAECHKVAMFKLAALGRACRTRSVKHDEEACRRDVDFYRLSHSQRVNVFRQQHFTLVFINYGTQFLVSDKQLGIGILHHKVQTLRWITWVERLIGTAGFQHTQRCDGHPLTARNEHRNHILVAKALFHEVIGDTLRNLVNLTISKLLVVIDNSQIVGCFCNLTAE